MKSISLTLILLSLATVGFSQGLLEKKDTFTKADTLRGMLRPERTCYDVTFYELTVKINPDDKTIQGTVNIHYKVVEDFMRLQIDLFDNLKIDQITSSSGEKPNGDVPPAPPLPLQYTREFNAVWVDFYTTQKKGTTGMITVTYGGTPIVAKKAPWDGGFVWTKDTKGGTWAAVACEGTGASCWWPCKDHLSDEPDSMAINIICPSNLKAICNGNMINQKDAGDGYTEYDWFVHYPINSYNVTFNIGNYAHYHDTYTSPEKGALDLDYYVMPYNMDKAKKQFAQVKPMMECYEKFFGPYPFWKDGYALVETPYLGMEHQGAIAYGNEYKPYYDGYDFIGAGLDFDYIIIHESAHEWWGNNISMKDEADMWIHEGFANYAEVVYCECIYGYDKAMDYCFKLRGGIDNKEPIIGHYNVNKEGSGDMYPKGANLLNTLRHVLDKDDLWWSIIKGLQKDFALQTVTTQQIESYMSTKAGMDWSPIFDQYLRHSAIPVFEYSVSGKKGNTKLKYRWVADVTNFNMRIKATTDDGTMKFISPTTEWQTMTIKNLLPDNFKIDEQDFYVNVKKD